MIFEKISNRYPNLVGYLQESQPFDKFLNQRTNELVTGLCGFVPGFLLGVVGKFAIGSASLGFLVLFGLPALGLGIAWQIIKRQRDIINTPEHILRQDIYRTVKSMRLMLEYKRLHRDLSESTLSVLEETARYRAQIRILLDSPFWSRTDLPEHYSLVKSRAIEAANQAMLDSVANFRSVVPDKVDQRGAKDYFDEVVESVFSVRRHEPFSETGFSSSYDIGRKLQAMLEELEEVTRLGELDQHIADSPRPGRLLDETMADLRHLRQAESELRDIHERN